MFKKIRTILLIVLALLLGVLAFTIHLDIPVEDLKVKYANEASQFVEINGMQVHYRDEGIGEAIVLLHGTAASLHTWNDWTTALKKSYRVIRLDLPAFGLTGPHPQHDYRIESYSTFLHQFIEKLQLDTFHLAGNSLGGNIAWDYAASYPSRVQKLILLDPSGYPMKREVSWIFKVAKTPVLNQVLQYVTPESIIKANLEQVYVADEKITPELVKRYHEMTLRAGNRAAFVERVKTPFIDHSAKLGNIKASTLLIWGKEDEWIPAALGAKFKAAIPKADLVLLKGVGHVPMEEVPQKSVKLVIDFLEN